MTEPDIVESAPSSRRWSRWAVPAGLLGTGALVGGILATTLNAGAAPSPGPSPSYGVPGYGAPGPGHAGHPGFRGPGRALDHTGTVTAVGTNSVTIKESAGAASYAVGANSDIDKNGEAKLSDLKVGDAVRFGVVTVSGKKTIGILHSGNEALNRPQHRPGDGDHDGPGMPGGTPGGSSSSSGVAYSA